MVNWIDSWSRRRKRARFFLHNRVGLANPRARPFSPAAPRGFAVVTLRDLGDEGEGKPEYTRSSFFRILPKVLAAYDIEFALFRSVDDFLASASLPRQLAILVLYNEVRFLKEEERYSHVLHALEERVHAHSGRAVLHSMETARTIADKARANAAYRAAGVYVPAVVTGTAAGTRRVFVNSNTSPGTQAHIAADAEAFSSADYNTEFIDTRVTWQRRPYFVSLRAMAAGRRLVGITLRTVPADSGKVAARAATTPADPDLLNHLYAAYMPWTGQIMDVVRRLGEVLGPGLYHHDLLPEPASQKIYVCESGFKIQNVAAGWRFDGIRDQVIFAHEIDPTPRRRAAYALVGELHDLGYY